jgi:hypothetical protein
MTFDARVARTRERMGELGVDVLLLSVGPDLPYLTGYEAMPLERLTMLVLPRDGDARLVVPRLEAPRVVPRPDLFEIVPWDETDDPIALVARLVGPQSIHAAIGDHTWARFVLDLQRAVPRATFDRASVVLAPIRMVKDAGEIDALQAAADAVDEIAVELRSRPFAGRTELDVHRELVERMLGRTSPSWRPANTPPARTTSHQPNGELPAVTSSCATSAARCAATAPTSRACSTPEIHRRKSGMLTTSCSRPRKPACAPRPSEPRARRSTPRRGA